MVYILKKTTNANCICDNEIKKMKNIEQIVIIWQNAKCSIVYILGKFRIMYSFFFIISVQQTIKLTTIQDG